MEARNQLEGLLYTTERSLDEYGDAIAFEDLMAIREAITKAQAALKSNSSDILRTAKTELSEAAQAIADALYAGSMAEAETMAAAMDAGDYDDYESGGADDGDGADPDPPPAE